jgi:hypothetical protein
LEGEAEVGEGGGVHAGEGSGAEEVVGVECDVDVGGEDGDEEDDEGPGGEAAERGDLEAEGGGEFAEAGEVDEEGVEGDVVGHGFEEGLGVEEVEGAGGEEDCGEEPTEGGFHSGEDTPDRLIMRFILAVVRLSKSLRGFSRYELVGGDFIGVVQCLILYKM